MNFLEKLDYLMDKEKINKNILSKKSGIPYTTLDGFYKKGYQNTKLSTVQKIANYFNVSLDYLIFDEITDLDYGKTEKFKITTDEMYLIQRYRNLDEYDKQVVNSTLLQLYINDGRRKNSEPAISFTDTNENTNINNSTDEISATKEYDDEDEFTRSRRQALEARRKAEQFFKENPHLMPIASHDRKGTFSEEDYKHDDDIMTNDDFWND